MLDKQVWNRSLFGLPWVLMLIVPAITMRSFSEEMRTGTIELLATKPISSFGIVLAKFFGALGILLFALLPTLLFIPIIGHLGQPQWNFDLGAIKGSYAGLIFISAAYTAIGDSDFGSDSKSIDGIFNHLIFSRYLLYWLFCFSEF